MSNKKVFNNDYFKGENSHSSEIWNYDLLTKLNPWRLRKYRKFTKFYSTFHETLLDIGCAYGHFLKLLKKNYKVYGMDISEYALKIASKRIDCEIKQGDVEKNIPFKRNFDIITALSVIEHLENPEKAIKNIHNHLNDKGLFCFEVPTISNKRSKFIYNRFYSKDETHVFIKSADEIKDFVSSCGFKKLAIFCSFFPIFTKQKNWVDNFSVIYGVFQKV